MIYDLANPDDRLRLALDQPTRDRRRMVAHIIERRQGKEARDELVAALRAQR